MIGQHEGNFDGQVTVSLPGEQIADTVGRRRAENQRPGRLAHWVDRKVHVVAARYGFEHPRQRRRVEWCFDLEAHEKPSGVVARKLLRLSDVAFCLDDCSAYCVDDSWLIVTDNGDDEVFERCGHAFSLG